MSQGGDVTISVHDSYAALNTAVESGELAGVCVRFGVEIVTLFGSALTRPDPGDLDIAVGFRRGDPSAPARDFLGVVNALGELVPGDHLDIMDLDRADPVAQMAALYGSRILYQVSPTATAERQMAAFTMYHDTQWLRDLQTEALRR